MGKKVGIYVHIPFCEKKCPYCGFYSTCYDENLKNCYVETVLRELEYRSLNVGADCLFFGGGTPSLLSSEDVFKIISCCKKNYGLTNSDEITLEANPNTLTENYVKEIKLAGVNRLSIGAQSANLRELKFLNRAHDVKQIVESFSYARKFGFNNISLDFIIGLKNQTKTEIGENLKLIKELKPEHCSIYSLKIEPKTKFFENLPANLPNEDDVTYLFNYFVKELKEQGLVQYEVSNFARNSKFCRHNLKYWNLEPYLGFGPAAHSLFNGVRFFHEPNLEKYLKNYAEIKIEERMSLTLEWFVLKMRLTKGVYVTELIEKNLWNTQFKNKVLKLVEENLMEQTENLIKLTNNGLLLLNSVCMFLCEELI